MTALVRLGGAWTPLTGGKVYAGSAWRTLVAIKVYASGAWRDVANFTSAPSTDPGTPGPTTFSVTASPPFLDASSPTSPVGGSVTVTPTGGLAPYTYNWSSSAAISRPHSATTTISKTLPFGGDFEGIATCVVTDSLGTAVGVTVDLSFARG